MNSRACSGLFLLLAAAPASPASAQIPTKIYAQQLVDETVAKNPELLVIVIHVTPPKSAETVIVASNIGRIGKRSDADDLRVIQTNVPKRELAAGGTRFEVELVLSDTSGTSVGALDLVFPLAAGGDQAALQRKAESIRDGLSRRILNEANLMDPYPMDPLATTKTRAQKLVDQTMARHPEVLSLAMHVTLPNGNENVILGSSFGRIGKKADEDDMNVIASGKTISGVYAAGKRFGLELALRDVRGATIGSLNVAYPYKAARRRNNPRRTSRADLLGRAARRVGSLRSPRSLMEKTDGFLASLADCGQDNTSLSLVAFGEDNSSLALLERDTLS